MSDILERINDEVPKYMERICQKYDMKCQKLTEWETAMYNKKCCLDILVDYDYIGIRVIMRENGEKKEYDCGNYLARKYDEADRVDMIEVVEYIVDKTRNALSVTARGLDSKWSALLQGDRSWMEDYRQTSLFFECKNYDEDRNAILNSILDSMEETSPTK